MEEKYMINDILNDLKELIIKYSGAIPEIENINLRNSIKKIRNEIEESQFNLYLITKSKGYYLENCAIAKHDEIEKIKYDLNI